MLGYKREKGKGKRESADGRIRRRSSSARTRRTGGNEWELCFCRRTVEGGGPHSRTRTGSRPSRSREHAYQSCDRRGKNRARRRGGNALSPSGKHRGGGAPSQR